MYLYNYNFLHSSNAHPGGSGPPLEGGGGLAGGGSTVITGTLKSRHHPSVNELYMYV